MLASFHYSEKKINVQNQCPTPTANQHLAILSVPCTSHFSEIMKCRPHTIEFSMSSTFSFLIVCNKNIFVFRGFRHLLSEKKIILTFLQPIFKFKVETVYTTQQWSFQPVFLRSHISVKTIEWLMTIRGMCTACQTPWLTSTHVVEGNRLTSAISQLVRYYSVKSGYLFSEWIHPVKCLKTYFQ